MIGKNTGLQVLDLSMNNISQDGGISIASSLSTNFTLVLLNLKYNSLSDKSGRAFNEQLLVNRTIRKLEIEYNFVSISIIEDIKRYSLT